MPASSGCLKFAILGVVALAGSASHLDLMIGLALPLKEMTEFAFSFYEGAKRKQLRDLSFCIANDVSAILVHDKKNMDAALAQAEWYIGKYGLSDREFADLGLDPENAADAVLNKQKLSRSDELEIGESTRKLLVHFYDCLLHYPDILQELLPDIYRAVFRSLNEGREAIREMQSLHSEALRMSAGQRSTAAIADFEARDFYELKCPATLQEYDAASHLATTFFSDGALIDGEEDRKAFIRNPYSMIVLLNEAGDAVGFVDIYYLPDSVLDAVLADTTGDVAIDPKDCLDYERARACTRAYIATIIVRNELGISSGGRSQALIYGMMEFLLKHQFHGTDTFELWAIGSTKPGQSILERLDFKYDRMVMVEPGEEPQPAYRKKFRKDELIAAQANFIVESHLRNVVLNIPSHP